MAGLDEKADEDERVLRDAVARIVERFAPRRIVLFGSRAWGSPAPSSDYDLVVLLGPGRAPGRLAGEMRVALWGLPGSFDIVAGDEAEFERWAGMPMSLEHRIAREGKVLYAAG